MNFKKYINNNMELQRVPLSERSIYYLDRGLLRSKKGFINQAEGLLSRKQLMAAGLLCKPFWEDEAGVYENNHSEDKAFNEYIENHPEFDVMIRIGLFPRLLRVQASLPSHLRLVIKAGLRPIEVQEKIFSEEIRLAKIKYPSWDKRRIYKYITEYVTDPKVNIPPHSTGGAIDIHLWDENQNDYIDFGSPINVADDSSWGENHHRLTDTQISLRQMLRDKMIAQGFANLASEWWHFSYGDQRWAVYYDCPNALYGAVSNEKINKKERKNGK